MILNFRLHYFIINTVIVLYLLTYLLTTKISLNTNFFDLITNVYINDFYLNSFYFIWTQFFILPSLLIIIHYKHTVNVLKYKNYITVTLIYATLIVLVWGVVDYYWTNQYLFINKNSQYFFNNLLNNPLNKYHPVLFFTSYLFIYNLASYLSSTTNDRYIHFYKNPQQINTNLLTNKINLFWTLMLFSLYLGAWWALQEGSWGGWWNWDASEVFGLLILTYLVLILHYKLTFLPQITKLMLILSINLSTCFVYCILQMSYSIVSHNFGLSLLGYGYTQFMFLFITNAVVYLYLVAVHKKFNFFSKNFFLQPNSLSYYRLTKGSFVISSSSTLIIIFTFLLAYLYLISFNPILNNIFWKSLNIEIMNKWFSWINVKLSIILLLILLLVRINLLLLITTSLSSIYNILYLNPVMFNWNINPSFIKVLHMLFVLSLLLPLILQHVLYTEWEFMTTSFIDWYGYYNRLVYRNNITIDNTYVTNSLYESCLTNVQPVVSFFWFHNNLDTQFFLLDLNETALQQSIYNHTYMYLFRVNIYDNPSLITDLSGIFIIFIYRSTSVYRTKIIF